MKKTVSILLSLLLCLLSLLPVAAADGTEEPANGTFRMLNYNIAGLPSLNPTAGKTDLQRRLGQAVAADDYDLIAVQEDFGYDSAFSGALNTTYRTYGPQSVVTGDGLNLFSKTPIYNVAREGWEMKGGMLWEGDIVSQKGFLYAAVEIADGVFIDVYDLHADAFGGAESIAARASNFRQLQRFIEAHSENRAVIITGDFNSSFHFFGGEGEDLYEIFIHQLGMKDVWNEVVNNGSYTDYSGFSGDYWGHWDSVEHILYRSGETVTLTALSHAFISYRDADGADFSDHAAAAAEFAYTVSGDSRPSACKPAARALPSILRTARIVYEDLSYVFSHFDEVITMLKYANDMLYLYEHYLR
ncbi:MAG: endonuclease/exonuclease/phosphatase family protein [Clostridia bacterium]|nr:endonuclease/exonuclease/phosphatase family protein [Clostridia bacterium]